MFPFPADSSLRLFDKPVLDRHEASLGFPLSPLSFDHELFNDLTLLAPPPQMSSSPSPPPLPPDQPTSSTHTKPSPPGPAAFFDLDVKCAGDGGAVGRRLRKDRHSKIRTAQGTRDRRMRLSLEVARKFFDLQDALGFDKASKTVDWLLSSCRSSIMELTGCSSPRRRHRELYAAGNAAKTEYYSSSTSECEVMSASANHHAPAAAARAKRAAAAGRGRDALAHPPPSRESRQMARDRARERTQKKKMLITRRQFEEGAGLQRKLQPAESGAAGTHTSNPCSDQLVAEEGRQLGSCSPDQCTNGGSAASPPAAIAGGSSAAPISVFDYDQNIANLVEEHNWDIRPSGIGADQEQRVLFADAQLLQPFLWEAFNPCIW